MTSASKRKGNGFENTIAKFLNLTFNTTEFARTPGSGAWMGKSHSQKRAGVAISAQQTLRGDLITPADFPYVIECKSYKDSPSYSKIIGGADSMLDKWLGEVEYDAQQAELKPMLWFKTVRKGTYVAMPYDDIDVTSIEYALKYRNYVILAQDVFSEYATTIYKSLKKTVDIE